ncbi:MAG TPA: substrate-binding domain-containing protein [Thermodesulfobacteriota bacterium]|nr:substrate-binding domain-containing protein [Deltaproteobacteria bacterium]HNR13968.1 substrate-binding domain-containing protein [Thermodesulfobacteriota bacterium]HNU72411.1 substrate-binding domain-containing protein [Thermodesulfobacteriota bacterium]HOC38770.1 substrate-binding domain-containing protein [Thermodesulfobacteriota bacterium]
MKKNFKLIGSIFLLVLAFSFTVAGAAEEARLRLATTTSTQDTGLLDVLHPPFEKKMGVKVDVIAVGTGKALELGSRGDVDVVLVHAREAEDKFVGDGYGVNRRDVMVNDFVIVGPDSDPAKIKGMSDAVEALRKIAATQAPFVSRGDDSGTHKKELSLWAKAGIKPSGPWYAEAGQGMGPVLTMAGEKQAYTLSDRGTFLAYRGKVSLQIMSEGGKDLLNPYGVIAVNPVKFPGVKYDLAMAYIQYLTGAEGQKIIGEYGKDAFGQALFTPTAISAEKK